MKLFLSKLLPLFTAGVILLCSVFALVPIESFADNFASVPYSSASSISVSDIVADGVEFSSGWYALSTQPDTYYGFYYVNGDFRNIFIRQVPFHNASGYNVYYTSGSSRSSIYINQSSVISGVEVQYGWGRIAAPSLDDYVFADLNSALSGFASFISATPTPEPTPSPTPAPTSAPGIDDFFRPFRSFSGAYYNSSAIYPPDSLTLNKYQQYTGLVSNKPIRVTDVRTNIDFLDDKVVYKFEYDFRAGATDSFDISVLYDADNIFGYDYAYITVGGETFDGYALSQSPLTGTYRVFGNADVPEALQGYTNWSWEHDLVNQKAISISGINLSVDDRVTLTVIVASSTLPHIPSSFDWSQFFQDTRPDNVFLATTGGLAALPFFISGLSFLALGALIGIILKFMR